MTPSVQKGYWGPQQIRTQDEASTTLYETRVIYSDNDKQRQVLHCKVDQLMCIYTVHCGPIYTLARRLNENDVELSLGLLENQLSKWRSTSGCLYIQSIDEIVCRAS